MIINSDSFKSGYYVTYPFERQLSDMGAFNLHYSTGKAKWGIGTVVRDRLMPFSTFATSNLTWKKQQSYKFK